MKRTRLAAAGVAVALVAAACGGPSDQRVVVGAGTTLVDSLLMKELVDAYANVDPGAEISVVGLSSAEAIALAESGDADVTITHSRDDLEVFLQAHPDARSERLFASKFFVAADPSIDLDVPSLDAAFAEIARHSHTFASREDGSGTHAAEILTWERVGIDPTAQSWYLRTGTGMGATLQVTDQRRGTTLTEHGAFLASSDTLTLVPVRNTEIPNPYDLTVVEPDANPAADSFAAWLVSPDGIEALEAANDRLFDQQVYVRQ